LLRQCQSARKNCTPNDISISTHLPLPVMIESAAALELVTHLAREAALGLATIRRAELAEEETSMTTANDLAVRRALEAAGVEFIDENGGGPGVRLRKRSSGKSRK
jgi:hypothetical protein